jgi:hypothetical protein
MYTILVLYVRVKNIIISSPFFNFSMLIEKCIENLTTRLFVSKSWTYSKKDYLAIIYGTRVELEYFTVKEALI